MPNQFIKVNQVKKWFAAKGLKYDPKVVAHLQVKVEQQLDWLTSQPETETSQKPETN